MDKYYKHTENDYVVLVGAGIGGEEITQEEYEHILSVIQNRPVAEEGFTYKLRTDLTWELCEMPPVAEDDSEATEEDYISALAELGVAVNE